MSSVNAKKGHPGNRFGETHGHATESRGRTPTYRAWESMKRRCTNPAHQHYASYGGRGIDFCVAWKQFSTFLADMGDRPPNRTLERRDNNGSYEPGNCYWATAKQQARNRRSSVLIEFQGRTQPVAAWCEELGLTYYTVLARLKAGYSPEIAFRATRPGKFLIDSRNPLTPADKAEICALRGQVPQRVLAARYGVAVSAICNTQLAELRKRCAA
jgi:hypothetical protein